MEDNNEVEIEKDDASRKGKGKVDDVVEQYSEYKEETDLTGEKGETADTGSKQQSNYNLPELAEHKKLYLVLGSFTMEDDNMSDALSDMSISTCGDPMEVDSGTSLPVWRVRGYLYGEVIDQSTTDCCVPITIFEWLTVGLRMAYGRTDIPHISIQYMMDCIPRCRTRNKEKCNFEDAYEFLKAHGTVFVNDYNVPFTGTRNLHATLMHNVPVVKIDDYVIVNDPTADQLVKLLPLLKFHPLICGIDLTYSFVRWKGEGIYHVRFLDDVAYVLDKDQNRQGHALLIVDECVDTIYGLCFQVKNSAGRGWGDEGYAWIDSDCLTHISYPIGPRLVE